MALVFLPMACCDWGKAKVVAVGFVFELLGCIYGEKRRHHGLGGSVLMVGVCWNLYCANGC